MVAIVGRPNVGKSTLLNRILGQKVSITTSKPQTTRQRIRGIKTSEHAQVVYVDTPGIHASGKRALNRLMNRQAVTALDDVDLVLMVVAGVEWKDEDEHVLDVVQRSNKPFVLVLNQVDTLKDKSVLLAHLPPLLQRSGAKDIVPVSARNGSNVQRLESVVESLLPVGEAIFAEDQITDHSMRFLAGEIVREKLMRRLGQELPYAIAVEIEQFKENPQQSEIGAVIWVERPGQKAIVIGKGGEVLKEVGTKARLDMERLFGQRVHLNLWVKVKEGWSEDERLLRGLGLEGD
jgi:GTP-binding protein Era